MDPSSTLIASLAISEVHREGWFGKVVRAEGHGTSNIGIFGGKNNVSAGDATNVVTDYVYIKGEARSPDAAFAAAITDAYRTAVANAALAVTDFNGESARVEFNGKAKYPSFNISDDSPAVMNALRAAQALGLTPKTVFSNGGLDANWLVQHGVPTITLGAGQHEIHTVNEFVDLAEFADGCRLAVMLATLEA